MYIESAVAYWRVKGKFRRSIMILEIQRNKKGYLAVYHNRQTGTRNNVELLNVSTLQNIAGFLNKMFCDMNCNANCDHPDKCICKLKVEQ